MKQTPVLEGFAVGLSADQNEICDDSQPGNTLLYMRRACGIVGTLLHHRGDQIELRGNTAKPIACSPSEKGRRAREAARRLCPILTSHSR